MKITTEWPDPEWHNNGYVQMYFPDGSKAGRLHNNMIYDFPPEYIAEAERVYEANRPLEDNEVRLRDTVYTMAIDRDRVVFEGAQGVLPLYFVASDGSFLPASSHDTIKRARDFFDKNRPLERLTRGEVDKILSEAHGGFLDATMIAIEEHDARIDAMVKQQCATCDPCDRVGTELKIRRGAA